MAIPPLKHVIDQVVMGANMSTVQNFPIAQGTVNPNSYTTAYQVRNGSIIRTITLELDYQDGVVNASNTFDWYIWFNIGGAQARPNPNSVNISVIKNQIFHQDGALYKIGFSTGVGLYPVDTKKWRLVIQVPRSFQQVNENDTIEFVYINSNNNATADLKAKVIYKEIFP